MLGAFHPICKSASGIIRIKSMKSKEGRLSPGVWGGQRRESEHEDDLLYYLPVVT